ncbi:hypothetical protein ACQ4PT_002333 [Festuca glaucescens]
MATCVEVPCKKRFRFEAFWAKLGGFPNAVASSWASTVAVPSDPLLRLDFKLRRVAHDLQSWSSRRVGSVRDQLLVANEVILCLDVAQEARPLLPCERELRRNLKGRVLGLASLERTIARQRARIVGIQDGDAAAELFRSQASRRRRRNFIPVLRYGDRAADAQEEKEALAAEFFADLLGRPRPRDHDLSMEALGLAAVDLAGLDAPFSEEEDNFVLVQQSAALLHRRKVPSMLLKHDVAKAFDSVSWPFLISVLRQRGFGPRWIGWLVALLRSSRTQVLVNGSEGPAFLHARGLRQGDPLSPLLFVLVMDVLAAMFRAAERAGVLSGLEEAGLKHRVSLYADDIVVFASPDVRELTAVREVLACFGRASGLVVNFAKSSATPIRCDDATTLAAAPVLSCHVRQLPIPYLGLPLSLRKPTRAELQPVLDKLANKLALWKAWLMSRDGRVAYVRAVMAASVVYQLMALDVDPWFIQAVDKLRRGFL